MSLQHQMTHYTYTVYSGYWCVLNNTNLTIKHQPKNHATHKTFIYDEIILLEIGQRGLSYPSFYANLHFWQNTRKLQFLNLCQNIFCMYQHQLALLLSRVPRILAFHQFFMVFVINFAVKCFTPPFDYIPLLIIQSHIFSLPPLGLSLYQGKL